MKKLQKTNWVRKMIVGVCTCLMTVLLAGCSLSGLADHIGDLFGNKTGKELDGLTYQLSADGTYYTLVDCEKGVSVADIVAEIDGVPVTTIAGDTFFNNRSALTKINIPDSVTTLEDDCISQCYYIRDIVIPDSVTYIGKNAFYHCRAMRSITIGAGVETIGDYAFYICDDLQTVNYRGSAAEWDEIQIGAGNEDLTELQRNYVAKTSSAE